MFVVNKHTQHDMDTLSIFKLVAGSTSALATVYALGRMFYVAATAPTNVRRINSRVTRSSSPQRLKVQLSYTHVEDDSSVEHYFQPSEQVQDLYKKREQQVA